MLIGNEVLNRRAEWARRPLAHLGLHDRPRRTTVDAALHAFYDVSRAEMEEVLQAMVELRRGAARTRGLRELLLHHDLATGVDEN